MRKFFYITFFCVQILHSQNVDKLKLVYSKGGSSWDKNGIYSTCEVFELFKTKTGDYKFSTHLKINSIQKGKSMFYNDTIAYKTKKYRLLTNNEIDKLLYELKTNKENYTEFFLTTNFLCPTNKEIIKIANKYKKEDYFKNDYDEKEYVVKKYSEIKNYKYFNEFLSKNKPSIHDHELTFDAWNSLGIFTFSNNITKIYNLQFFKNCGQPISIDSIEIDEQRRIKIFENANKQVINLEVNKILQSILPQNTILYSALDLRNIRDNYIKWFLENKSDSFKY
jgi:hypothetical protein